MLTFILSKLKEYFPRKQIFYQYFFSSKLFLLHLNLYQNEETKKEIQEYIIQLQN